MTVTLQWLHMSVMASQITNCSIVCWTARSSWQQRKYQLPLWNPLMERKCRYYLNEIVVTSRQRRKFSKWQLSVQLGTGISPKWQHFRFSDGSVTRKAFSCHHAIVNAVWIWPNMAYVHYSHSLCLRPANERRRYFVTTSVIGWAQA